MGAKVGRVATWTRARMGRRSFPWVSLGITALLGIPFALLVILATWLEHRGAPPSCYGIGWGCTLDPGSSGAVFAILWFSTVGCAAAVLALTELVWERVAVARSIVALVLLVCALALVALMVVAVIFEALV